MQNSEAISVDYQAVSSNFDFAELYEWQRQALRAWSAQQYRGVIEAVTGAGKTRVGIAAIAQALRLGMKVTVLVPTSELQDQWVATLRRDLSKASVGRLGGTHTADFGSVDVIVAIINSAGARSVIEHFRSGLVVADECHRYAAPFFATALEEHYLWRLGLTATYTRQDGQNAILDEYFGPVVYRIWYDEAQRYDVISKFDIALVGVHLRPHEQETYDTFTEKIRTDTVSLRNYLEVHGLDDHEFMEAVGRLAQRDDGSAASAIARRYQKNVAERQQLLANTVVKNHALAALAPSVDASERTLVFGSSRRQAEFAAQTLNAVNVSAGYLISGMSKVDRLGAMNAFRRGDLKALCAPRVLDEGVDVPAADLAIQTSGSRVQRQFIQRLGRVIRKRPSGDRGRFVYLYAFRTIEDPATRQDFLPDVLPYARRYMYFDLEKHLDELIEFLAPQPAEIPIPSTNTSREPSPQRTDFVEEISPPAAEVASGPRWNDIYADTEEPRERLGNVGLSDDAVGDYLTKIGRYALLSHEEMVELAQQVEAGLYAEHLLMTNLSITRRQRRAYWEIIALGKLAFETMINSNLRLVVSIAKRHFKGQAESAFAFLDIIQEGNLGLIRALKLWNYKKEFQFSTYAFNWIRQAITRSLADSSRLIRLPVHVVEELNKIVRQQSQLSVSGRTPTDEELAAALEMSVEKVQSVLNSEAKIVSLSNEWWIGGEPIELADLIVDHMTLNSGDLVVEQMYHQELRAALEVVTADWSARDQDILFKRAGITTPDRRPATLDAIGQEHDLSRERIRQIERKVIDELAENQWLQSMLIYDSLPPRDPQHDDISAEISSGCHTATS